jgi:hypothetical protein
MRKLLISIMAPEQDNTDSRDFRASHIRTPNKDVIGGKIHVNDDKLVFEPNSVAEMAGEGRLPIPLYAIKNITKETAGRGIIYSLTNGRLAGHLHIILNDGTEYVFTVPFVDEKIELLSPLINSATEPDIDRSEETSENKDQIDQQTQYCPSCGEEVLINMDYCPDCGAELSKDGVTQETGADSETNHSPRFPILSVFSSLMLLRGGAVSLNTAAISPVTALIFFALGVSVIPRVRVYLYDKVLYIHGADLASRIWSIAIALVYTTATGISSLLLVGELGIIGAITLVIIFIFSVIIVLVIRIAKKIV